MTNPINPQRHQNESPVSWPVLYRGDDLLAEGTVLDLTPIGWRVAGPMPVTPGMQLTLQLWVPEKPEPVRIERATVLWVRGCEFAIEGGEMAPSDQAWVTEFLNRRIGLSRTSQGADHLTSFQLINEGAFSLLTHGDNRVTGCEDMLRIFIAAQINMDDIEEAVVQRSMVERGCREEEARTAYDHLLREVWQPAFRILNGMVAQKARREQTGQDSITNN